MVGYFLIKTCQIKFLVFHLEFVVPYNKIIPRIFFLLHLIKDVQDFIIQSSSFSWIYLWINFYLSKPIPRILKHLAFSMSCKKIFAFIFDLALEVALVSKSSDLPYKTNSWIMLCITSELWRKEKNHFKNDVFILINFFFILQLAGDASRNMGLC